MTQETKRRAQIERGVCVKEYQTHHLANRIVNRVPGWRRHISITPPI